MTDKTYIRRSKHDALNPYMMLRRDTAQNKLLSYEALGLLTYLLSKPDDWRVQIGDLQRKGLCGRDKARGILDELVAKGYAKREEQRHDTVTGRFEYGDYEVAEMPIFLEPFTENPSTVKPYTVNPTLHSNELDKVENTDIAAAPDIVTKNVPEYLIPVFVAVANHIFNLKDFATFNLDDVKRYRALAQVARTKAGKDTDAAEIAYLVACYAQYCNDKGYNPPQAQSKFSSGFDAYLQNNKPRNTTPTVRVDELPQYVPSMDTVSIPAYDDPTWSKRHD